MFGSSTFRNASPCSRNSYYILRMAPNRDWQRFSNSVRLVITTVASARFFAFCIVDAAFSFTYSCGLLFNSILCSAFRKVFRNAFSERITRASSGGLNEVSERLHGKQRLISIKSAVVLCGRLLDAGEFGYR
ncbi:hypothetical protein T01_4165 [Trichinella spiralis]|uniref:Uncharacterized protein n=1 Tax=Trichinella spiralis TaxID=6334 RepID=A0A0V1B5C6_TRISP|nr:hypothetical protein T01_4165 [Trichinella spiralis]